MLPQVLTSLIVLFVAGSILAVKFTDWYSKRCVAQSTAIVQAKLRFFEAIANTYTENGTPEELRTMIEGLEEMVDELQMLEDNNPPDNAKSE
jgi:hypothetical protein